MIFICRSVNDLRVNASMHLERRKAVFQKKKKRNKIKGPLRGRGGGAICSRITAAGRLGRTSPSTAAYP